MYARSSVLNRIRRFPPTNRNQSIYIIQSPASRAINVGFIQKKNGHQTFVPGRLNFGVTREEQTFLSTVVSLKSKPIQQILKKYSPEKISTVTVLRETLACRLPTALREIGIRNHYGDAFIGATHIKGEGEIKTAYLYENTEGLVPDGLWILADSICVGRNTGATLASLLPKFNPKEIIILAPIASRRGMNEIGKATGTLGIPTTFIAWGALFGVDEKTLYDMPWGHKDTEALDERDQKLFVSMFGPRLCVGGDFGNDYYCPPVAKKLYDAQLAEHGIKPKIPSVDDVLKIYKKEELHIEE